VWVTELARGAERGAVPRELFQGGAYEGGSSRAKYAVTADGSRFLMSASRATSTEMAGGTRPRVVVVQN